MSNEHGHSAAHNDGSSNGNGKPQGRERTGAGSQPLHILQILGNAIVGGMERYVQNLVWTLPPEQYRVTFMVPYESSFSATMRRQGCAIFVAPMRDDPAWRSIQMAAEIVRHYGVDLIHGHLPSAHVLGGLAGNLTRTPAMATIHGMNISTQELGISRTTGTHLITVCQEGYTQALAMGVPRERLTLIPNGVDTSHFSPEQSGAELRRKLEIPERAQLVGYVARLSWEKGPDQFVRAAAVVHQQRPDVHFAMVGEGPLAAELAALAGQLGLQEHLHMAGLIEETAQVYPAFDLFVQSSRSEGMPLALLEAMASARPVAAMTVGGIPEIVEVGTTGTLVPAHDHEGLGRAILELLARPERLAALGQAARARVQEHFDLRQSVRLTSELIQRLAGTSASHRTKFLVPSS